MPATRGSIQSALLRPDKFESQPCTGSNDATKWTQKAREERTKDHMKQAHQTQRARASGDEPRKHPGTGQAIGAADRPSLGDRGAALAAKARAFLLRKRVPTLGAEAVMRHDRLRTHSERVSIVSSQRFAGAVVLTSGEYAGGGADARTPGSAAP